MLKGRTRPHNYTEIVEFVATNPTLHQAAIANHFGVSKSTVSRILSLSAASPSPVKGRPRSHNYSEVVAYAAKNPELSQSAIAKNFGITQSMVSRIMRVSGVEVDRHQRRGRNIVQQSGQTDLEHKWESILHQAGLGMNRGLRLHGQRIFYGFDPRKATYNDRSATLVAA